jgi:hypothetical protein
MARIAYLAPALLGLAVAVVILMAVARVVGL